MNTKKIELMGVNIDCLTLEQTVCVVDQVIRDCKPSQHVVVNALKFAMMNGDSEIRHIVNSCDIVNADGLPVVWASRLLGKSLPERVAGIDLFNRLVKHSADKGYRPFFLGAGEEIVRTVVSTFKEITQPWMWPVLETVIFLKSKKSPKQFETVMPISYLSEYHLLKKKNF